MDKPITFNEWLGTQGNMVLFHANCCRIAYEAGQQSMQAKVEEANAKAQMCRDEKNHAINRWSAVCKERDELQKRVDSLTQTMEELLEEMKYPTATFEEVIVCGVKELEQALKGEG